MPYRPRNDLPRLSGRPDAPGASQTRDTQTVFRRFFDLLERFDKSGPGPAAPPAAKMQPPQGRGGQK